MFLLVKEMSMKNNMLFTLIGLSIAIMMYQSTNKNIENFINVPRRVLAEKVAYTSPTADMAGAPAGVSAQARTKGLDISSKQGMYNIPGHYQAALQPRISGDVNYGANIRYKFPDVGKLGSSQGSLDYSSMGGVDRSSTVLTERYSHNNNDPFDKRVPSNHSAGNYQQQLNSLQHNETVDMLPSQSMSESTDALGQMMTNPIIYDRFIYANQNSRLAAAGDPIRGDLPITPNRQGWFQVSAHPQIDLKSGALAAIGGLNNDTSKELLALQSASSGGSLHVGGGVNYSVQQSAYGASDDSVTYTAFP